MQFFGPKFGFVIDVIKSISKISLSNTFRDKVNDSKKKFKIHRDVEYLIERLKEMGITADNYK